MCALTSRATPLVAGSAVTAPASPWSVCRPSRLPSARPLSQRACTCSGRRRCVCVASSANPGSCAERTVGSLLPAVTPTRAQPMLALSSTTSTQLADVPTSEPTILARTLVGAAVAFSAIYALLSPATSAPATVSFPPPSVAGGPAPPPLPSPLPATASAEAAPASPLAPAAFVAPTRAHPSYPSLRLLRTPDQFDAFVLAANRAGYLAVVLFHAPWCEASGRMEAELNRLSRLFTSRRIVFARVDCAMKARRSGSSSPGVSPTASVDDQGNLGAAAGGFGGGALSLGLQRCDLTQLHRIHKTPTVRMYYSNNCVDEVIGCRPIEFRQACSDVCFKFKL